MKPSNRKWFFFALALSSFAMNGALASQAPSADEHRRTLRFDVTCEFQNGCVAAARVFHTLDDHHSSGGTLEEQNNNWNLIAVFCNDRPLIGAPTAPTPESPIVIDGQLVVASQASYSENRHFSTISSTTAEASIRVNESSFDVDHDTTSPARLKLGDHKFNGACAIDPDLTHTSH